MENIRISEWLDKASVNIIKPGDLQDIHIDEIINFEIDDKESLFIEVLEIAKCIKTSLIKKIREDCRLYLYVALESDSNSILGVPRTLSSLVSRVDLTHPPELVLYKEYEETEFNKVELYKSCLPFATKYDDYIEIVYRELRPYFDLVEDEEYQREIHIIIK